MRRLLCYVMGVVVVLSFGGATLAWAQEAPVKIGIIGGFSGAGGVVGEHGLNGFRTKLDLLGGKLGGKTVELVIEDDQGRADVGVQLAKKFLERDNVDFVVAFSFSNVMTAIYGPIVDSKKVLISGNSMTTALAGELCSRYIFSAGVQNDMNAQALAALLNSADIKDATFMGPNYEATHNMQATIVADFKGNISNTVLTPLSQLDFSAELTQLQLARPEALVVFYPGAFGVSFVKQYSQMGLRSSLPVYAMGTVGGEALPAMGDAALGIITVGSWSPDLDFEENEVFVRAYEDKYNAVPSWYAAFGYDTASLIDAALKTADGVAKDSDKLIKALETVKFPSVRGDVRFNKNHILIQNWYEIDVAKDARGRVTWTVAGLPAPNLEDPNVRKCTMN